VAKVRIGFEPQVPFLQRLAVVLADPLRLKIVTELYLREMSPTLFFEEFGGGSVSRVARHFEVLAKHCWLRYIRSETGGRRFGGVESFYRAPELVVFDNETWAELPYSIRAAFSATTFNQFAERVTEAIQAETFDARPDRHFTWTPILLDQIGWERIIAALNVLFESLFEEQEDAKLRIYNSGEEPIRATVALGGFESPGADLSRDSERVGVNLGESTRGLPPFTWRVSKVFADPLCLKIVAELNLRAMSATEFHRTFGGASKAGIHRRFKMLTELGWLKKVSEETGGRRRGATERFFRAAGPAVFDNDSWCEVPSLIRSTHSWTIFEQLSEQFKEAMEAGTVDARPDRHLSWSLLLLDRLGWEHVIGALDALFAFIFEEQAVAEGRAADSGEERIRMTVALAGFESPRDLTRAP
jgi:hypothetical protein